MGKLAYVHMKLDFKEMTKDEVEKLSKKAVDLNPKSPITWYSLGICHRLKNEPDKTIECLKNVINLDPNFTLAWTNLYSMYIKKGEINNAIDCIKQVKRLDPSLFSGNLHLIKQIEDLSEKDIKKFEDMVENTESFYRLFRDLQSAIRSLAEKSPNSKEYQIMSKMDLSNISDSIKDFKKNEFKYFLEVLNPIKRVGVINLIPFTISQKIKSLILKLAIKYDRLHIAEIAEKCGEPEDCIIVVSQDMIKEKEIYAEYFKSTKSVVFDKQANIDEIDALMEQYKKWEEKGIGKK